MRSSPQAGWVYGVLAAALWSPHFYAVESLRTGGVPPFALALHLLFWPALACAVLLFVTGRTSELSLFHRHDTRILVLAAVGGYGFWVLRMLALESARGQHVRFMFYTAPLLIGLFGLSGREKADARAFWGLVLGLAGCYALVRAGSPDGVWAGPMAARFFGLGAAACWAVFSMAARPIMREERVLPVVALVTGIGAVCLGVTCVSRGDNPFDISPAQLRTVGMAGLLTVGLMMAAWLKCLASATAAHAGLLWYLGALFGVVAGWCYGWHVSIGWTLAGAALIAVALRVALRQRTRARMSMGDLIRGG